MSRSFSYAAYAALLSFTANAPDSFAALEPWADAWQYWISDAFLKGYRQTIGDTALVPRGDAFASFLGAFALEKAMYELGYELDNRPDWVRIPMAGIMKIVSGGR